MTTIEFVTKRLNKAKINLEKQTQRAGVSPEEIARLEEKVNCYQEILSSLRELEITRAYIHDNGLVYDLFSYTHRKGFWE